MKLPIYMDNHATTPMDPRVLEAILPFFMQTFGNAASRNHSFGWDAEAAVETARKQVARLINADPKEIIFTSGATESDNLAIKGLAWECRDKRNHIVTLTTEHKAVLDTCRRLESGGYEVTYLPVDREGLVEPEDVGSAINERTMLVTIMAANNEIGVLQPVQKIGQLCHERGVFFHTDATQAVGKVPIDVAMMKIDLMSISAHKMYGPKGAGALYVRRRNPRLQLVPLIDGGGHERGLRSGTLNVPAVVGFGKACEISMQEMAEESERLRALRDRLRDGIFSKLDGVHINGSMTHRLPHNLNLSFSGVEAESLLLPMKEVALSSGAACTSAKVEPSHVLKALGLRDSAYSSVRFGLGRFNTEEEVEYVIRRVVETVQRLRQLASLSTKHKRSREI
jgi:cysteine desulfurase